MASNSNREQHNGGDSLESREPKLRTQFDNEYLNLINYVLKHGDHVQTRQGGKTISCINKTITCSLLTGSNKPIIPWLTIKHVPIKSVVAELIWFLKGSTNAHKLKEMGSGIWVDDSAKFAARQGIKDIGDLGPVYGYQWRKRPAVDQIERAVNLLVSDPFTRRNLVCSWDPDNIDQMAVPPCHYSFQFIARKENYSDRIGVTCIVNMRSTDVGLGLPFNVVSYSLLTHIVCNEANLRKTGNKFYYANDIHINMADCHIYQEHAKTLSDIWIQHCCPFKITSADCLHLSDDFHKIGLSDVVKSNAKEFCERTFEEMPPKAPVFKMLLIT